jgi:hypothetical protein
MQPYFLPYIGYFQLISAVDKFVVYDNIKYTKKGWINRNRMLLNGKDVTFSLPLKKDSDYLNVVQRELSTEFDRAKLLNQFKGAYGRAPYFGECLPLLERVLGFEGNNLFRYIRHALTEICAHLEIDTDIRISSSVDIDHDLRGQQKVLALCKSACAKTYVNPIGGTDLYSRDDFRESDLDLKFIKSKPLEYSQFGKPFVPWLSIVDVLMFNSLGTIKTFITNNYDLI